MPDEQLIPLPDDISAETPTGLLLHLSAEAPLGSQVLPFDLAARRVPMVSLTIDLPEEAFSALRVDPNQFALELRFAAAVQWYHQGLISGSKAAEIAGMSRLAFLDELARRRLDTVKIDFDDLAAELRGA